jgi:hypothetical protein
MRRLEWLLASIAGLVGILHVALTAVLYQHPSLEALWFAGTGLGIIAVAAVNIVGLRASDRSSLGIVFAANAAMVSFFASAWALMKAPQVALGIAVFAGLAICSALRALMARRSDLK